MVSTTLKGKPGTDISNIRPGIGKTEVEMVVGQPIREWTTSLGVRYCVYRYDAGVPPSAGDAAAIGFLDVISLGLAELFFSMGPPPEIRKSEQMAVSYNAEEKVVGVFRPFGDFDMLPPDGWSNK